MPKLKELASELASRLPLRECFGRPQKLSFVDTTLYWLEGATQALFCADITSNGALASDPRRVIITDSSASTESRVLTKEEELLRERQRTLATGISWYAIRQCDRAVFFIQSLALYVYAPRTKAVLAVLDCVEDPDMHALLKQKPWLNIQLLDPNSMTPTFVFVMDGNLYRLALTEGFAAAHVIRLTLCGKELSECGTADYIMQEEFDRYTGQHTRGVHTLFLHTDSSMLAKVQLASDSGVEDITFPRVGDPNALSSVCVASVAAEPQLVTLRCLPHAVLESYFSGGVEYITRFGFVDDQTIFVQVLDRRQENSAIVVFEIESLPQVTSESVLPRVSGFHKTPAENSGIRGSVLWSQSLPWAWCEITNCLHLDAFPQLIGAHCCTSDGNSRDGYFHLLQRDADSAVWQPMTSGSYNIKPSSVVRAPGYGILFESNSLDRLGNSLFVAPLSPSEQPRLLSAESEYVHTVSYSPSSGLLAYVSSTAKTLATIQIVSLSNPSASRTQVPIEWALSKNVELLSAVVTPEIVTYPNARGSLMSGALFLPHEPRSAAQPLPLMMYVYGGPHVQLVSKHLFELSCNIVIQTLVRHGVAVVIVDNQMSNANCLAEHSICKKNMGCFETEEYVSFKHQLLAAKRDLFDESRVGIFGWSYGGYATLLAMCQAPAEFKLGFAGAPVGDWKLYDTGYTERYMGLVTDDTNTAYERGRVSTYAGGFPDDLDRLYIAHGLLDENVHMAHTCVVVSSLIDMCKPYHMLVYPGERHGLRQKKASRMHYDAQLIKTIIERL